MKGFIGNYQHPKLNLEGNYWPHEGSLPGSCPHKRPLTLKEGKRGGGKRAEPAKGGTAVET